MHKFADQQEYGYKIAKLLILITFIYTAYFYDGSLSNQNVKINAIFAVVEKNPDLPYFAIDEFVDKEQSNSLDWSYYNGHYYANKAPGSIIFGSLVYWPLYHLENLLGINTSYGAIQILNCYLINLILTVLPLSLAAGFFFLFLVNLKTDIKVSALLSILLIFGLPLASYSTTFWSHSTAAAFLIIASYFFELARNKTSKTEAQDNRYLYLSGLFLGLSVLFDYLCLLVLLILTISGLFLFKSKITKLLLALLPGLLIMSAYHYYCFGSVFVSSVSYTNQIFTDQQKFLGVFSLPKLDVLYQLLRGHYRGIFTHFPFLWLIIPGIIYQIKNQKNYFWSMLALASLATYYLLIASFNGWHSGAAVTSRYLIPVLFCWILLLKDLPKKIFIIGSPLILLSIFNNLLIISTSSLAPDKHPNPLYGFVYQNFFNENLAFLKAPILNQRFDPNLPEYQHLLAFNWGNLLGLSGYLSLLPVVIILGILILNLTNHLKSHA